MKDTIIEYTKAFVLLFLVIGLIYWTFKSFSDGNWITGSACAAMGLVLMMRGAA